MNNVDRESFFQRVSILLWNDHLKVMSIKIICDSYSHFCRFTRRFLIALSISLYAFSMLSKQLMHNVTWSNHEFFAWSWFVIRWLHRTFRIISFAISLRSCRIFLVFSDMKISRTSEFLTFFRRLMRWARSIQISLIWSLNHIRRISSHVV
jgi:hypothetical protein